MEEKKPWWLGKKNPRKKKHIFLSTREEDILIALRHATVKVVAGKFNIEEGTVRSYVSIVRKKKKDAKAFIRKIRQYNYALKKE